MNETEFHSLADAWLRKIADSLEDQETLEVDLEGGILNIETPSGKILIVSKHAPSFQLWLASPLSGGLHFSYDGKQWALKDGRTLEQVLSHDLESLAQVKAALDG